MARGVANNQQCITNNLGFQLGATTFTRYKSKNRQRVIAGQNVMLKNVQFGNFGCDNNHRVLGKKHTTEGKQSNGFTGTSRIIFPVPSTPQATTDHLRRIQTQHTRLELSLTNARWPSPPGFPSVERVTDWESAINSVGNIPYIPNQIDLSGTRVDSYIDSVYLCHDLVQIKTLL
eukprot:scaffold29556_cov61-Attheya_sp.AAC.4